MFNDKYVEDDGEIDDGPAAQEYTKKELLVMKMEQEAGHYNELDDVKREKEPLINTVKLEEKSLVMNTTNRNKTVEQIKV